MGICPGYPRRHPNAFVSNIDGVDGEWYREHHVDDGKKHQTKVSAGVHRGIGREQQVELHASDPERAQCEALTRPQFQDNNCREQREISPEYTNDTTPSTTGHEKYRK